MGLSCKEPSTWDSCWWLAGPGLQEFSRLSSGKGQVFREKESPAGSWPGAGEEGPVGCTQGRSVPGPALCFQPPGLSSTGIPSCILAESCAWDRLPTATTRWGPVGNPVPSRQPQAPSGGGQTPHQQGQKRQEEHRRPPCSLTDLALTVTVSGFKGCSGGSEDRRAHTGGGAVQELGTHGLGGVWLGFDAALGEAPVVDALEEVGVTCGEGGDV